MFELLRRWRLELRFLHKRHPAPLKSCTFSEKVTQRTHQSERLG